MRWDKKKKVILDKEQNREYFAWFPVTIEGETRWLERVKVKGYYFIGPISGRIIWMDKKFID